MSAYERTNLFMAHWFGDEWEKDERLRDMSANLLHEFEAAEREATYRITDERQADDH